MMEDSISGKIRRKITRGKSGKIIFARDFNDIGDDELINKALFRLERNKTLIRLSHGIYLYPVIDKELGIMLPAPDTIAKTIAKRDSARILPTGNHALNLLGLSTQVPMNVVYMTDGSPRKVNVGKRKITFKKTSPRNFIYKGKIIPLVVAALKTIGKDNVTPEYIIRLERILTQSEDKQIFKYPSLFPENKYLSNWVKIEISCRSLREPFDPMKIRTIVADNYPNEKFADDYFIAFEELLERMKELCNRFRTIQMDETFFNNLHHHL